MMKNKYMLQEEYANLGVCPLNLSPLDKSFKNSSSL